jgi:hypothetical protein
MPSKLLTPLLSASQFQEQVKKHRPRRGLAKHDGEHQSQCEVISDFDRKYPDYTGLLFAIPNGAKLPFKNITSKKTGKTVRVCKEAQRLKAEGLRSGVPDLMLPVPKGRFHGLFIEMKYGNNKPTPDQVYWLNRLMRLGYCCKVCYSREEAVDAIEKYLNEKEK